MLSFNRINSGRSIPTVMQITTFALNHLFQSYQFRQINPDTNCKTKVYAIVVCFNRINSGRSIPTKMFNSSHRISKILFQSYQFRQINPDAVRYVLLKPMKDVSIVSIQADQSRPASSFYFPDQNENGFQSYQFRQINPDECINQMP